MRGFDGQKESRWDSSSHHPPLPTRKSSTKQRAPTFDRELSRSRWCDRHALRQQTCFVLRWRGVLSETRWETSSLMPCYGRDCARVVLVVGCTDSHAPSVHPPSSHSVPSPPTHPPDFILPHFPPSFFTSSFTLVQTHSTHVLSPAFSFFSPHFSPTPSHPSTRLITFLLHHFSYVYYGASCVHDRDLTLFPCPSPSFPSLRCPLVVMMSSP